MSDAIRIVTNNVPRFTVDAYELTPGERAEHDYLNWPAIDAGEDSATFVRYLGHLYYLGDFTAHYGISRKARLPDAFSGWDGYLSDSYFSGVLIRFPNPDDGDTVIMGRFFS